MKKIVVSILIAMVLVNCGSRKNSVAKKSESSKDQKLMVSPETTDKEEVKIYKPKPNVLNSTEDYIERFKPIAIAEMNKYGIPASITLAQGILESGSGKGRLAVKANNHFGIKCHDWSGEKIYHDDDRAQECFRKYKDASYSFRDHSEFLSKRKRYSKLFDLKRSDYKGWARELRRAGYATDKRYPEKLVSLIERYELYKYDGNELNKVVMETPPSEHVVIKGDTLFSISKKYNLSIEAIRKLNGLNNSEIQIGQTLYLKQKE
jgi:flagellum-specific peptidoglycan hydrolase FlgJ